MHSNFGCRRFGGGVKVAHCTLLAKQLFICIVLLVLLESYIYYLLFRCVTSTALEPTINADNLVEKPQNFDKVIDQIDQAFEGDFL